MIYALLDVHNCLHACTHVRMRVACKAVMVSLMAVDYSAMGVDTATEFESESDAEGRVCECVWLCCARVQSRAASSHLFADVYRSLCVCVCVCDSARSREAECLLNVACSELAGARFDHSLCCVQMHKQYRPQS